MIEFTAITSAITKYGPQAGQIVVKQAQKNEIIIKIFNELKLNPTQIPDDVDGVYAYSLVYYGVYKHQLILNLLREKVIKDYFWDAYCSNSPFKFVENTRKFLDQNTELDTQIIKANINILAELDKFGEVFISVAQRTKSEKYLPYPDWDLDVYPKEFKALISEKTRLFCGREFVFKAIQQFITTKNKGYFTVVGDAGMGKSAIASQVILGYQCPCYFNIFAEGRNTPDQFLASIRQQLIKRYSLQNADNADLRTLLQKASEKLTPEQKLVIVVDALDEVEQAGNSNLLDLPQNLPRGVYFLLTTRPYEKTPVIVSSDTPYQELNLTDDDYLNLNRQDVGEYLSAFLDMETTDKIEFKKAIKELLQNHATNENEIIGFNQWIQQQNPPVEQEDFINILIIKSQNNFMYLRYVLPAIATGQYNDLSLKGLPEGLERYYITHWQRMGMDDDDRDIHVKILFILVIRGQEISSNMIAEILEVDIYPVEKILAEWVGYVTPKKVKEEETEKTYYSIYHRSFLEFLQKRPTLDVDKNKKRFREIKERIDKYLDLDI